MQHFEGYIRVEMFLTSSNISLSLSFFTFMVLEVVLAVYNLDNFIICLSERSLYADMDLRPNIVKKAAICRWTAYNTVLSTDSLECAQRLQGIETKSSANDARDAEGGSKLM